MFFREVLNEDLGCASYFMADEGEAAVIDPKWEIDEYLDIAANNGYRITRVLETHNHADHLSGRGRLIAATGATVYVSADAGVDYEHQPLKDGEVVEIGQARITALATPGHRPEHLCYLVADMSRADEPWVLLSGDSLFVGDLARPDLAVAAEEGARGLFRSLQRIVQLPDYVELRPGHIGGSLCGGPGMSMKPDSTIGFERRHNPYLDIGDEESFVKTLTSESSTPQPPNFERIVELNRGPLVTEPVPELALMPSRVKELMDSGAVMIDGRDQREFDGAHVPGAVNVTMNQAGVGTRAAWAAAPETQVVVTAPGDTQAVRLVRMLEAVGFQNVAGYLSGGVLAWNAAGFEYDSTPALDVSGLAERLKAGEVALLDVRSEDEWKSGHVEGSINVPYQSLRNGVPDELRQVEKPIAVACSGGIRSALAASLLKREGIHNLEHVADGGVPLLGDEGIDLIRDC
ncbi:MAG: rhodanese-like domain-containing protein [Thermomicrobiaceae bacterium]